MSLTGFFTTRKTGLKDHYLISTFGIIRFVFSLTPTVAIRDSVHVFTCFGQGRERYVAKKGYRHEPQCEGAYLRGKNKASPRQL